MGKIFRKISNDTKYMFACPGCGIAHYVDYTRWKVENADTDKPTVSPSILVQPSWHIKKCHSFIKDGNIQFSQTPKHSLNVSIQHEI